MSEFKFACPHCQQNIQATSEYSGMQINCPVCQAPIVVPAPEGAAAPSAPKGKLSKAPSTVHQPATSPVMQQRIVRKSKKPNYKLYAGLGIGAVVIVAGVMLAPKIMDKFQEHKEEVAAAQAATNPPPPPPEPGADEILKKVQAAYKGFKSYRAHGESTADLDLSQLSPTLKTPIHSTAKVSILLGRGAHYRIQWERQIQNRAAKGEAWSSGRGDYVGRMKVKNWEAAMETAGPASGTLAPMVGDLFFDSTNSFVRTMKDVSKSPSETLDGRKCYVIKGTVPVQKLPEDLTVWVDKEDFLVDQFKLTLSGNGQVDPSVTAGMNAAQKAMIQGASKTKGTVVESYSGAEKNFDVKPDDFKAVADLNAAVPRRAPTLESRQQSKRPR